MVAMCGQLGQKKEQILDKFGSSDTISLTDSVEMLLDISTVAVFGGKKASLYWNSIQTVVTVR